MTENILITSAKLSSVNASKLLAANSIYANKSNICEWLEIIHECQDSGLSNQQSFVQNELSLKSDYDCLSKIEMFLPDTSEEVFIYK